MKYALVFLLSAQIGCGLVGTIRPPEAPPQDDSCTHTHEVHRWSNYHLPHRVISEGVVLVNNSSYKVDPGVWNDSRNPIVLRVGVKGFQILIEDGGDANSGWLGLASVRVDSDGHIVSAKVTMNTTLLAKYSTNVWKHVLYQEIGHLYGLDHQRNPFEPSAMDDCQERGAGWLKCLEDPDGITPNPHDFQELQAMYEHAGGSVEPPEPCEGTTDTFLVHAFTVPVS